VLTAHAAVGSEGEGRRDSSATKEVPQFDEEIDLPLDV
jgi:hypothetical protein